jgi:hypothetical protein
VAAAIADGCAVAGTLVVACDAHATRSARSVSNVTDRRKSSLFTRASFILNHRIRHRNDES